MQFPFVIFEHELTDSCTYFLGSKQKKSRTGQSTSEM